MNVTVIGVAGGTGSGKSTLVKRLQEAFVGDDVVTLCHDYYYKAHPELTYEERTKLNYDHPQAFDTQMLVDHIKALKDNVPIEHPVYSFVDHDRTAETVCVKPSKVIIVDGILIFENKELRDMMDIKVYVDTDADIRLARRILRDVCERGRTMQSVITQYTSTVKPMHDEFVEPSKRYADVIIPEGGFNSVAVAMLIQNSFYLPDGLFADQMPERSGRPQVITTAPVRDSKIQRWLQYTNCRNYWHCRRRHSYSKAWYGKYHDTVHILKLTPARKPVHKKCP